LTHGHCQRAGAGNNHLIAELLQLTGVTNAMYLVA
jgi:hypothetical protein